ncbi:MAG: hypothetical protein ACQEP3_02710 [Patescibacteria group bacterium]
MIDQIEKLKKRGEISFEKVTINDLFILKEFFDLEISGDRKKVYLKKI